MLVTKLLVNYKITASWQRNILQALNQTFQASKILQSQFPLFDSDSMNFVT